MCRAGPLLITAAATLALATGARAAATPAGRYRASRHARPEAGRHTRGPLPRTGHAARRLPTAGEDTVTGVTIAAPKRTVKAGGTVRLRAKVEPPSAPQKVSWSSADTTVAVVDAAGLVTAVRTGKVSIRARSTADHRHSASVLLTIECPAPRVVPTGGRQNATWEDWILDPSCFDYESRGAVEWTGGVLRIQPGTVVGFSNGAELVVSRDAALSAVGTATRPIRLTGVERRRGAWRGLRFTDSGSATNRLDHVTIEYGGGPGGSGSIPDADLMVTHSTSALRSRVAVTSSVLRESAGYGLWIRGEDEVTNFSKDTLTANTLGPALLAPPAVDGILDDGVYTGNDADFITVTNGGGINNIRKDATWRDLGVPYRIRAGAPNELDLEGAALRIQSGVEIRFGAGMGFSIIKGGFLALMGTAGKPVTLRGDDTRWRGIQVHDSQAYFDHAAIRDAGVAAWGGRKPGAVTLTASNGGLSRVTLTPDVTSEGAPYGTVFTAGSTFASGCLEPVFIPPPHKRADHCNGKGVVAPPK